MISNKTTILSAGNTEMLSLVATRMIRLLYLLEVLALLRLDTVYNKIAVIHNHSI